MCLHDHTSAPLPPTVLPRRGILAGAAALAGISVASIAAQLGGAPAAHAAERPSGPNYPGSPIAHPPLIIEGGRPPRYVAYGGVDAFNARMTEQKRGLSPAEVRRQLDETHRRLVDFVRNAPEDQLRGETRFRRRLRLDTYGHYPEHTEAIRAWREQRSAG